MITRVYFHEDAEKEFGEAVAFYAMEEEALGLAFVRPSPVSPSIPSPRLRWPAVSAGCVLRASRLRCCIRCTATKCESWQWLTIAGAPSSGVIAGKSHHRPWWRIDGAPGCEWAVLDSLRT